MVKKNPQFKAGEVVVYPKHGVGQITEFKKINIGGIDVETYVLKFEKDKANGMVPVNKQSNLRPLATVNQVNKCISLSEELGDSCSFEITDVTNELSIEKAILNTIEKNGSLNLLVN